MYEVILNDGLKEIGEHAFNRAALERIAIPSSVVEIGLHAFSCCSRLREVVLHNGLKRIGMNAFRECNVLRSIELPSTVTEIGKGAFSYCSSLREVVLNEGVQNIKSFTFKECRSLQSITIPSTVIEIEQYAFRGSSLREIIILNDEIRMLDKAFGRCSSLERFSFPSLFTRLNNIIRAGQRDIVVKMRGISAVEWRDGELIIPAISREIENEWGRVETVVEVDKEKLDMILGLIAYYEVKEADNLEGCKLSTGKKISNEELFKQPPTEEDCPICMERMPTLASGYSYMTCCGKVLCSGCVYAPLYDDQGNEVDNEKCPFCRTPWHASDEEIVEREKKRAEAGDAKAIYNLGLYYRDGEYGLPQDHTKALELFHRSAELGYAKAYNSIGFAYHIGKGVEVDEKKARHYYEIAAMGGDEDARHNLGVIEEMAGNMERALKHHMIAVRSGESDSLDAIKEFYSDGHATKDDYTKALQSYQAYLDEIKSPQRDEAAAADEENRYY